MLKRIADFHWHAFEASQPHTTLQLIAAPILVLGALLLVNGLVSTSLTSIGVGVIGLVAAVALQRHH